MNPDKKPPRLLRPFIRSFQNKYLLSLLVTALVPLLVTLVLVLTITRKQMENQQIANLLEKTGMVRQNLEARLDELDLAQENLTNLLVNQVRFNKLNQPQTSVSLSQYELLRSNFSTMETLYSLNRIRVYTDNIPYLTNGDRIYLFPAGDFERFPAIASQISHRNAANRFNYVIQRDLRLDYGESAKYARDFMVLYNSIYSIYNGSKEYVANCLIFCSLDSFLDCAASLDEGSVVISTDGGEIICANSGAEHAGALMEFELEPDNYVLKEHQLIARYDVPLLDWTLTVSVPVELHVDVWHSLGSVYLGILLATFVFALCVGILISRLQVRRLQVYFNAVKAIDYSAPQSIVGLPDQLDQRLSGIRNPDEIDQLMHSFSTLMRDNMNLISNMKQHDLEIEKYKFKVLQEQINPHFLYNALETLRLCMMMGRREDALQSLDSLSRFYRIALSKGRDTISIQEELDMITNYLTIENIGYNNAIQWNMDVDEECLDMPIPKFLLQPLVENSILHSKMASGQSALKIDIQIHHKNNNLCMVIRDNGSGIDAKTLAAIQEGLANNTMQKGKNGFGLSNVNRRLKLFYGNEYGLEIQSRPGCTENIIVLPIDILW